MIVEESALYARPISVHPSQSRRALHNLAAQGYEISGGGMYGGQYVIVILLPDGAPTPDWRSAPASRPASAGFNWPAFNWRVFVQLLCVLAIVGGVGYLAYAVFSGADLSVGAPDWGGISQSARDAWDDIAAPWQPEPTPVPEPQTAPAPWWRFWNQEPDTVQGGQSGSGWLPRNPVGDAIDTAGQVIMWLVWALVAVGVLWLVSVAVGIVRRVRG